MHEKNPYEPEKPETEMRFRTVLKDSTNFKGLLKGITAIVNVGYFIAKPEGIYLMHACNE